MASAQLLLGMGALVAAPLVWSAGTAGLAFTSATQSFPRDRRRGRVRCAITCALTSALVLAGVFMLAHRVGAWALVVMVAAFLPLWVAAVVRRRQAARQAPTGARR